MEELDIESYEVLAKVELRANLNVAELKASPLYYPQHALN